MTRVRAVLTDRLYQSLVGVLLVLVVAVAYLFAAVLDRPLTEQPAVVTVRMPAAGGLFEGSAVTYRGVKVGRITDVATTVDGVAATARLDASVDIPVDTEARVRSLSPVGEQYLDLQPRTSSGPFLTDGDVVEATATDLPTSLGSTVVAVSDLLDQVDDRALRRLLGEVSTGLAGTGQELGRLVQQADLLLAELDATLPEAEDLLRNTGPAASLVVEEGADLARLGRSARGLAGFLRSYDPRLREILRTAPQRLRRLDELVAQAQVVLPGFLSAGIALGQVLGRRDPHLRALLRSYAPGLSTVGRIIRDEHLQIDLVTDQSTRCRYDTVRREPRDIGPRPLDRDGRCAASQPNLQRGAAHAPGPTR